MEKTADLSQAALLLQLLNRGSEFEDPMPAFVVEELDRCMERSKKGLPQEPPNMKAVMALRQYFQSDEADPSLHGGFIDCMENLGAAQMLDSKDELVYRTDNNIWYTGRLGGDTYEWWLQQEEQHEARVRLLRYKEFIDLQTAKGRTHGNDWFMSSQHDSEYSESDDEENNQDKDCTTDSSQLTDEQVFALGNAFTMGFFYYANFEKVFAGVATGVKSGSIVSGTPGTPEEMRTVMIDIGEDLFLDQCEELTDRYEELRCPLGPPTVLVCSESNALPKKKSNGKKGKKKRKGTHAAVQPAKMSKSSALHSERITDHLTSLLTALDKNLLPTRATAIVASHIFALLISAARFDPDVAKALVNDRSSRCGSIAIELHSKTLEYAKKDKSRPGQNYWWEAASNILNLLGEAVFTLLFKAKFSTVEEKESEDDTSASQFFFEQMVPQLLPSMKSSLSEERGPALKCFGKAAAFAQHSRVLALIGEKKTWGYIEKACRVGLADAKLKDNESKLSSWQRHVDRVALGEALTLVEYLCRGSQAIEKSSGLVTTVVAPTALAVKMVRRGLIPLLMEIADADVGYPSIQAMEGLANISRVKDCRAIMLQEPRGIELVRKSLSSSNGSLVSPALLLVLHLLWDEEWWPSLSSIEPTIELTVIRWSLFTVNKIIERAEKAKLLREEALHRWTKLRIKSFRLKDGEEKEKAEQSAKEEKAKIDAGIHWLNLESDKNQSPMDSFLCRCILVISAAWPLKNGVTRLFRVDALSLLALGMDCPIQDSRNAAVAGISNISAVAGAVVSPTQFMDPGHVIRSIITSLSRFAMSDVTQQNQKTVYAATAGRLRSSLEWDPYFDSLPDNHKCMVTSLIDRLAMDFDFKIASRGDSENQKMRSYGIDEKCKKLTGKLKSCYSCGKIEPKRGNHRECAQCKNAVYCSKECQKIHWREGGHKLECKKTP